MGASPRIVLVGIPTSKKLSANCLANYAAAVHPDIRRKQRRSIRSCQTFCGLFSGFSRTRHSVSIVKLSWQSFPSSWQKTENNFHFLWERLQSGRSLQKDPILTVWCSDSLLYLLEAADQYPRYGKLALQLWCLTTRVKAAGRSKVRRLEYKSYRVPCPKTGTGKRSKYQVKQSVFIDEVRSIASRWKSFSDQRYRK